MDSKCMTQIREILETRKSPTRSDGIAADAAARRLAALSDCIPELRATADRLLGALPNADEGALNVVLSALTELSAPGADAVLVRALENRHTMLKEDYVSLLEYLNKSIEATAGLLTVLEGGLKDSPRSDLTVTIRALHALRVVEAAPLVVRYVGHPDRAVRGVAMEFLFDLVDTGDVAGQEFFDQLYREHDPARLEQIIDGLVRWDRKVDESFLRRLAEDFAQPQSLRDSARRALSDLPDDDGSESGQ